MPDDEVSVPQAAARDCKHTYIDAKMSGSAVSLTDRLTALRIDEVRVARRTSPCHMERSPATR